MLAEFGQIALILALMVALLQALMGLVGGDRRDKRLIAAGDRAAIAHAVLCVTAFLMLKK